MGNDHERSADLPSRRHQYRQRLRVNNPKATDATVLKEVMTTLFRICGGPFLALANYLLAARTTYALFDMYNAEIEVDPHSEVGAAAKHPER
ncbi:hypothetical protein RHA1_ro08099 (plasmid) [Rhodococcus jostii RHA1]|uniref:Uncharacterized protein n=2 Tax=Rhodococcus jostii TaxID=132919 RepID=Q0RZZ0_RHOJR|nr:hypothetical protein RHA1_ro08099 [Rhodococcus jostii RHA1]